MEKERNHLSFCIFFLKSIGFFGHLICFVLEDGSWNSPFLDFHNKGPIEQHAKSLLLCPTTRQQNRGETGRKKVIPLRSVRGR